jgi:hypothetical protein
MAALYAIFVALWVGSVAFVDFCIGRVAGLW